MIDKDKILKVLSEKRQELKEKYGFKEMYLFGSFAKGLGTESSDVDLAVNVEPSYITYKNCLDSEDELTSLLGQRVDLVYLESMNPIIKKEMEKDKVIIE